MTELLLHQLESSEKYALNRRITIGRFPDNDIVIDSEKVSRHHCLIDVDDEKHVFIKDLTSTNGTYVNEMRVDKSQLHAKDLLRIGLEQFLVVAADERPETQSSFSAYHTLLLHPFFRGKIKELQLQSVEEGDIRYRCPVNSITTIGRFQFSDIALDDPGISRHHSQIEVREHRALISDMQSTNGTFVNGTRILQQELYHDDVISIGNRFQFRVLFDVDTSHSLSTVQRTPHFRTINFWNNSDKLLEFFRNEFGNHILVEVERQTLLFCEEFDLLLSSHSIHEQQSQDLEKILRLLANPFWISEYGSIKASLADKNAGHPLFLTLLQHIDELITDETEQHVMYFETISPPSLTPTILNGLLVNLNPRHREVIVGVSYENMTYLLYASNWLRNWLKVFQYWE